MIAPAFSTRGRDGRAYVGSNGSIQESASIFMLTERVMIPN